MHASRITALAIVLAAAVSSHADVDVTGNWSFCMAAGQSGGVSRPTASFTQTGTHVSGTMVYPFFQGTMTCAVGFEIDSATGAFVPGTATETCPFNVVVGPKLALATTDRIDGEYGGPDYDRRPLYALRRCDPMVVGACDDGDPGTVDTCSTTVDCFGVALPPSCIHTGCTTDADCADAYGCTYDHCDAATGCSHPTLEHSGDPRALCEDGNPCTVNTQCDLTTCGDGAMTATVASITAPKAILGRLGPPAGNDTLVVKGRVILPTPLTLDPTTHGSRVLVLDAAAQTVLDVRVPGGAFDPLGGFGWTSSGKGVRYVDKRKVGQGPIRKVTMKSDLGTPGLVLFTIAGKAGTFASTFTLPLGVFVNLDVDGFGPNDSVDIFPLDGGACATFPGPSPACTASGDGTKIRCR